MSFCTHLTLYPHASKSDFWYTNSKRFSTMDLDHKPIVSQPKAFCSRHYSTQTPLGLVTLKKSQILVCFQYFMHTLFDTSPVFSIWIFSPLKYSGNASISVWSFCPKKLCFLKHFIQLTLWLHYRAQIVTFFQLGLCSGLHFNLNIKPSLNLITTQVQNMSLQLSIEKKS